MTDTGENREAELAGALKQLSLDYHEGRLSMAAYRRLRHTLLDRIDQDKDTMPLAGDKLSRGVRPGWVVWVAIAAIVGLLAGLGWLLR